MLCLPAGDFDTFASLIKATRLRDAERKAQQAKANTAPSAAADPPVSLTDSAEPPLEDGRPQPLHDAAAPSIHTDSMASVKRHQGAVVQPARHERLNPSDAEMLLNTCDQHRQQPASGAQPSQHRTAADRNQADAVAVQSQSDTRVQQAAGAAEQNMRTGSGAVAACPAGAEASHDQSVRQLGSCNASRHRSTLDSQQHATDRSADAEISDLPKDGLQDRQVEATSNGIRDRLSGDSFAFDIDDGSDGMQQPDIQHARALQHSQLLNTRPALLSEPVQPKQTAALATSLASKSGVSGVLHSCRFGQSTADALGELDAVVADSDSE